MNTQQRKIAGFMTAEGIYSLAFYVIMVAAIAGIGASILVKKDSAIAASAISLLRANIVADAATLGPKTAYTAADINKLSGNLIEIVAGAAVLSDSSTVTVTVRTAAPSYSINVVAMKSPEVCNAIGGVGWGTWSAFNAVAGSAAIGGGVAITNVSSKADVRAICDALPGGKGTLTYGFNL